MGSLSKEDSQPPVATTKDHVHEHHGIKRSDPYYWLKDSSDAGFIANGDTCEIMHIKRSEP